MRVTSLVSRSLGVVVLSSALLCSIGCNQSPFEIAPVHGTVTIDGQPMTGGRVMFAPVAKAGSAEAGKPAFGLIQSDGSYELSTYGEQDGAVIGDHRVTVYGPDKDAGQVTLAVKSSAAGPPFSRLSMPGNKTVVAGQDNQIDLSLSRQEVARYGVK